MMLRTILAALGIVPAATHADVERFRDAARHLGHVSETTKRVALDLLERQQAMDPHAEEPQDVKDMRALMAGVLDRRHRP